MPQRTPEELAQSYGARLAVLVESQRASPSVLLAALHTEFFSAIQGQVWSGEDYGSPDDHDELLNRLGRATAEVHRRGVQLDEKVARLRLWWNWAASLVGRRGDLPGGIKDEYDIQDQVESLIHE